MLDSFTCLLFVWLLGLYQAISTVKIFPCVASSYSLAHGLLSRQGNARMATRSDSVFPTFQGTPSAQTQAYQQKSTITIKANSRHYLGTTFADGKFRVLHLVAQLPAAKLAARSAPIFAHFLFFPSTVGPICGSLAAIC